MEIRHALFDLNGTLFDPAALSEPLGPAGEGLHEAILSDTVQLAMTANSTGAFGDFAELMKAAAARRLELAGMGERLEEVIEATAGMRPFAEAGRAMEILREAGIGAGVLTNSASATAERLVATSELDLDPILGTDAIGAFKPHPRVYEHGLEVLGLEPEQVVLFSAHSWDLSGARAVGLRTAWVARSEGLPLMPAGGPDFRGADLAEVAAAIVAGR